MTKFKELDDKYRETMQNYMKAIDAGNERLVDVLSRKLNKLQEQMLKALEGKNDV